GATLAYRSNAELTFHVGEVTAALDPRWELTEPPGGGDRHRSFIRGTRAEIRVEQDAETGFRRRLSVIPAGDGSRVRAALARAVTSWQDAHPGLAVVEAGGGGGARGAPAPAGGAPRPLPPLPGGVPPPGRPP